MTAPKTGRKLVDFAMRVERADETSLRVAMGYLIGASAHSIAVRRALQGALDAGEGDLMSRGLAIARQYRTGVPE